MNRRMNKKQALEFLHKLGITDSELKEIYEENLKDMEKFYYDEEEYYRNHRFLEQEDIEWLIERTKTRKEKTLKNLFNNTIKDTATDLYNYGCDAVGNFYYPNKYVSLSEASALMEKHENSFKKDFYLSFVRNIKYSISINLKGEEYEVITPKTVYELIKEGQKMHNCLKLRAYWAALGSMKFFFIRKKDDIESPWIDVILDKNNKIIWAITDKHNNVEGVAKDVVDEWYKICFGRKPNELDYVPRNKWFSI